MPPDFIGHIAILITSSYFRLVSNLTEKQLLELGDDELFCRGGCHIFADELFERLQAKGFVLRRLADGDHRRFAAYHVYVSRGDMMVDVNGVGSEQSLISRLVQDRQSCGYKGPIKFESHLCDRSSLFIKMDCPEESEDVNCWYLPAGQNFVEVCRRRARARIEGNPDRYLPVV